MSFGTIITPSLHSVPIIAHGALSDLGNMRQLLLIWGKMLAKWVFQFFIVVIAE